MRYLRTFRLGPQRGWIKVKPVTGRNAADCRDLDRADARPARRSCLACAASSTWTPGRTRSRIISARDSLLARGALPVSRASAYRACLDGFEMAVRAILGPADLGRRGDAPWPAGSPPRSATRSRPRIRRSPAQPSARAAGRTDVSDLPRWASPRRVPWPSGASRRPSRGANRVAAGPDPTVDRPRSRHFPGIGDWTAHYIAMRPCAGPTPSRPPTWDCSGPRVRNQRRACPRAEAWRPWRRLCRDDPLPNPGSSWERYIHE